MNKKVLVVEGDPLSRRLIEDVVRAQGFAPHVVTSILDADRLLREIDPKKRVEFYAVVVDAASQPMSLLEFCQNLRRPGYQVPPILVHSEGKLSHSAVFATLDDIRECFGDFVHAAHEKPLFSNEQTEAAKFKNEELLESVAGYLKRFFNLVTVLPVAA